MAKFYGALGFSVSTETSPGVWKDVITERKYTGDIVTNQWRWTRGDQANPNVDTSDIVSVLVGEDVLTNPHSIKYVKRFGRKWAINSVTVEPPRLVLNLGGLYNGQ